MAKQPYRENSLKRLGKAQRNLAEESFEFGEDNGTN